MQVRIDRILKSVFRRGAGGAPQPEAGGRRGIALVLVLAFLVLITVFVIAFFSSVTTENSDASSYAAQTSVKQLADTAVNIVIGTIRTATTGTAPNGGPTAWASQPGMIRTYDNTGNPAADYKLYSSDAMVLNANGGSITYSPNAISTPGGDMDPNWGQKPAFFTDLNSPVATGTSVVFPIIDGHNLQQSTIPYDGQPVPAVTYETTTTGSADIEGFGIVTQDTTGGNVGSAPTASSPTVALDGPNGLTSGKNPVPMPAKWIYVLKDGGLITPDYATSGSIATFTTTPANEQPTQANPIVGRIAFWTDDETCKVNINTASEGTYWDEPYTSTPEDVNFANSIPLSTEYQRIPGHPATTCLSPILGSLLPRPTLAVSPNQYPAFTGNYNQLGQYYLLNPRTNNGGTDGGTIVAASSTTNLISPILQDNRLYNSADELMFQPSLTGTVRTLNAPSYAGAGATLNTSLLEQTKFFLTASSRAPDLNLFGRPRISLWPLQVSTNLRNAKDNLLAFCTTTGSGATAAQYYFQQYNAFSSANGNFNQTPSSQSTSMDWTNISRNQSLFGYLQELASTNIPGFGGNFFNKYVTRATQPKPTGLNQILVEMMDYIRSGINIHNEYGPTIYDYAISEATSGYMSGQNAVSPLVFPSTSGTLRGVGNLYTVCEVTINFFANATASGSGTPVYAYLSMGFFNPWNRPPAVTPDMGMTVSGLTNWKITNDSGMSNYVSLNFPADGQVNVFGTRQFNEQQSFSAGYEFSYPTNYGGAPGQTGPGGAKTLSQGNGLTNYPYYSVSPIAVSGNSFMFSGGTCTISLYDGYDTPMTSSNPPVQNITVVFPKGGPWPVPTFSTALSGRTQGNNQSLGFYASGDVSRSMQVYVPNEGTSGGSGGGDLRLLSLLDNVPSSFFMPSIDGGAGSYASSTPVVVSLRQRDTTFITKGPAGEINGLFNGVTTPLLVSGANPGTPGDPPKTGDIITVPAAPLGLTAAVMTNGTEGDWDSGPGQQNDGPFLNRILGWSDSADTNSPYSGGFFGGNGFDPTPNQFTPSRQVASAMIFGDLPTGINQTNPAASLPWQTLLFCPNPAAGGLTPQSNRLSSGSGHPGFGTTSTGLNMPPYTTPPDHLFLDLFTMPVVEPYAISDRFSTAGRINMNYEIEPFTYIVRNTGIDAVMKSVQMTAIPTTMNNYKYDMTKTADAPGTATPTSQTRFDINVDGQNGTLTGFQQRFDQSDIFRSPSEICNIFLVPNAQEVANSGGGGSTPAYNSMNTWWNNYQLTGKNAREAPYAAIYPRLTTKSNSFRVHYRVQTLKQVASGRSTWASWNEGQDQVLGEYRGSQLIERYIDPNDPNIPDYAPAANPAIQLNPPTLNTSIANLEQYYKFHIIDERQFP